MRRFLFFKNSCREKTMPTTYDKQPRVDTSFASDKCFSGWDQISAEILANRNSDDFTVCVECYPGALNAEIAESLTTRLNPTLVVHASEAYRSELELRQLFDQDLTEDPVFGRMNQANILDFFVPALLERLTAKVSRASGTVLVIGTGACLVAPANACLVYADMARWEIHRRQRRNMVGNLGMRSLLERPAER